jgi:hypothetical protein
VSIPRIARSGVVLVGERLRGSTRALLELFERGGTCVLSGRELLLGQRLRDIERPRTHETDA